MLALAPPTPDAWLLVWVIWPAPQPASASAPTMAPTAGTAPGGGAGHLHSPRARARRPWRRRRERLGARRRCGSRCERLVREIRFWRRGRSQARFALDVKPLTCNDTASRRACHRRGVLTW